MPPAGLLVGLSKVAPMAQLVQELQVKVAPMTFVTAP